MSTTAVTDSASADRAFDVYSAEYITGAAAVCDAHSAECPAAHHPNKHTAPTMTGTGCPRRGTT